MFSRGRNHTLPLLFSIVVFCFLVNCQTAAFKGLRGGDKLKQGKAEQHNVPYPDRFPIGEVTQNGKNESMKVRYVGWDFDHDGNIDMLEPANGPRDKNWQAFDFNWDGTIDNERKAQVTPKVGMAK